MVRGESHICRRMGRICADSQGFFLNIMALQSYGETNEMDSKLVKEAKDRL